jgi:hypothetical protein
MVQVIIKATRWYHNTDQELVEELITIPVEAWAYLEMKRKYRACIESDIEFHSMERDMGYDQWLYEQLYLS